MLLLTIFHIISWSLGLGFGFPIISHGIDALGWKFHKYGVVHFIFKAELPSEQCATTRLIECIIHIIHLTWVCRREHYILGKKTNGTECRAKVIWQMGLTKGVRMGAAWIKCLFIFILFMNLFFICDEQMFPQRIVIISAKINIYDCFRLCAISLDLILKDCQLCTVETRRKTMHAIRSQCTKISLVSVIDLIWSEACDLMQSVHGSNSISCLLVLHRINFIVKLSLSSACEQHKR